MPSAITDDSLKLGFELILGKSTAEKIVKNVIRIA